MKKYAAWFVAAALLVAGAGCTGTTTTTTTTDTTASGDGRAVFMLKNSGAAVSGVTAVKLTVDKVEAHSLTRGWVTVATATKTFDLAALRQSGSASLLADATLAAGTYDQVRLNVLNAEVTASGTAQTAKMPSGSLKIMGNLTILAGQTTTVTLDMMADKSLHRTGDGKWILAPVVRFLSKDHANVNIDTDGKVEENGGDTESDETHGMDVDGEMHSNFELKDKLDIDATGAVKVHAL